MFYYNKEMTDKFIAIYDMLWNTSFDAVSRGEIDIDPHITHPESDHRRGLTLIIRPSPSFVEKILSFLDEIKKLEPDQYYYSASNLHFTVLSLFTATTDFQQEYDRLSLYKDAVEAALRGAHPFVLKLSGLTVSKSAVLLCGFPQPDEVNSIRRKLRENLMKNGLGGGLDTRYVLVGNHTTITRFSAPLRDPRKFSQFLLENKGRKFGQLEVNELQLMKNDWYMTQQHSAIVANFSLREG